MSTASAFSLEPMLCERAERPPEGREWRYELKLDGFRAIGRRSGRSTQLWSRNQKDFTRRFPGIAKQSLTCRATPRLTVRSWRTRRKRQTLFRPSSRLRPASALTVLVLPSFRAIAQGMSREELTPKRPFPASPVRADAAETGRTENEWPGKIILFRMRGASILRVILLRRHT